MFYAVFCNRLEGETVRSTFKAVEAPAVEMAVGPPQPCCRTKIPSFVVLQLTWRPMVTHYLSPIRNSGLLELGI